jgi:hypothetical protein
VCPAHLPCESRLSTPEELRQAVAPAGFAAVSAATAVPAASVAIAPTAMIELIRFSLTPLMTPSQRRLPDV